MDGDRLSHGDSWMSKAVVITCPSFFYEFVSNIPVYDTLTNDK